MVNSCDVAIPMPDQDRLLMLVRSNRLLG